MCYHAHYIFLACGHSVTSLSPIPPSPPCPAREPQQNPTVDGETDIETSQRPFSFDPSVIASPVSVYADSFPAQTPWRLESPFSNHDSATSTVVKGDEGHGKIHYGEISNIKPTRSARLAVLNEPEISYHPKRGNGEAGQTAIATGNEREHCGQILTHPYRSYKIEGPCLHCCRRRDTLLASFEVNSIRETVDRESALGYQDLGTQGRRVRKLSDYADGVESRKGCKVVRAGERLKKLPVQMAMQMPMAMPVERLGRKAHHAEGLAQGGDQQQQTPWRLTLPPAEIPRTGLGLAGMRDGEWI